MTAVGLVILYEILSRLAKSRARRTGRLTDEQKEIDQQRVQADRMNQLREVQLQRMMADREVDEEIEKEEAAARRSEGKKRRKKRQSICGIPGRPRASSASSGKEERPALGSERLSTCRASRTSKPDRRSSAMFSSAPGPSMRAASSIEFESGGAATSTRDSQCL